MGILRRQRFVGVLSGRWVAVLVLLSLVVPCGLARLTAQESKAKLKLSTDSEEARQHFWAALHDAENVFYLRAAARALNAVTADPEFGLARVFHAFVIPGVPMSERTDDVNRGVADLANASLGEMLFGLALREWGSGNAAGARILFHTASKMLGDDPHLAYFAAMTLRSQDRAKGIEALKDVTARFPEFAAARNILAYDLWNTGDRAGGLASVRKYVELIPDHPNSHDSYAELLQWAGRYDQALEEYRRAVELDVRYVAGYTGLAEVYQLMGNGKMARGVLRETVELVPIQTQQLNLRRAIGVSYLMDGEHRKAMSQFDSAAREAADCEEYDIAAQTYREMAVINAFLGDGKSVEANLAKAAKLEDTGTPGSYAWSTWALALAKQPEPAREYLTKFEKVAKDDEYWRGIGHGLNGLIYAQAGEMKKAVDALELVDPDNVWAQALLAECYDEMGRKDDARRLKNMVLSDSRLSLYSTPIAMARLRVQRF